MSTLPCITIWQPWASLIILGAKPYEFRKWPAHKKYVGKRIGIHAGARMIERSEVQELILRLRKDGGFGTELEVKPTLDLLDRVLKTPEMLPRSALLGTAVLGEPRRAIELFDRKTNDSDRIDHAVFGWPLTAVQPCEPIIPMSGKQGFWNYSALEVQGADRG